jgi:hypothetical protein
MIKRGPDNVQARNSRGEWVPAIPFPFFGTGIFKTTSRCDCGEVFKTEEQYRGHYALVHILGLK